MDEYQIYQAAKRMLDQGADPAAVDARIAELRQGGVTRFPNFYAMRMAHEAEQDMAEHDRLISEDIGAHPVRSMVTSATQGASFGGVDEALSLIGKLPGVPDNLGARQRLAAQENRKLAPGATMASEILGGVLTPSVALGGVARTGGGAGRMLLRRGIQGALSGSAAGAATGALSAEPGHRLEAAGTGGLWGAAAGAPMGVAGGVIGALMSRGNLRNKLAEGMAEHAGFEGIEGASARQARNEINRMRVGAQVGYYKPLEQAHSQVSDAPLRSMVRRIGNTSELRSTVPAQLRSRPGQYPSFKQLQNLRSNLRERAFTRTGDIRNDLALEEYNKLTEQMNAKFGQDFIEANSLWERSHRLEEALNKGVSTWDKSLDDVLLASQDLDPQAMNMYNRGRISKWMSEISRGEGASNRLLNLEHDWDRRAALAQAFPGGEEGQAFQGFMDLVKREAPKEAINSYLTRIFVSGGVAVTGGIIGGAIGGRVGGRNN
jgi:hypothetical protein